MLQPMKVCSKWVCLQESWVDFECLYVLLWMSKWLLSGFYVLLRPIFDRLWAFLGQKKRVKMAQNTAKMRPKMGQKSVILGWFWTIFGSIRGYFGATWGPFWPRFVIIFGLFWHRLELIFGLFWCDSDHFGRFLGRFFKAKNRSFGGRGGGGWKKCIETLKPYFEEDT